MNPEWTEVPRLVSFTHHSLTLMQRARKRPREEWKFQKDGILSLKWLTLVDMEVLLSSHLFLPSPCSTRSLSHVSFLFLDTLVGRAQLPFPEVSRLPDGSRWLALRSPGTERDYLGEVQIAVSGSEFVQGPVAVRIPSLLSFSPSVPFFISLILKWSVDQILGDKFHILPMLLHVLLTSSLSLVPHFSPPFSLSAGFK